MKKASSTAVQMEIEALCGLDTPALRERWSELFGKPPSKGARRDLLLRALAYRIQAHAAGGLRPAIRRQLARVAEEIGEGRTPSTTPPTIKPGTRLLREWQGMTHEVIVLENGVQYRGMTWASLSAVAREITGTRWSGPRFFGLTESRHGTR